MTDTPWVLHQRSRHGPLAGLLTDRGATVALAGRDSGRLTEAARVCGGAPLRTFDAYDGEACAGLAQWAADELSGLDAVALTPVPIMRAALPLLPETGAVVAVTGVVAERPQPGMADYSAAKAALAAWLGATRKERRRGPAVLEARLPHLDTGFAGRPVVGSAPVLPPGADLGETMATVVEAIASGAALVRPGPGGSFVME
ncbi:SDR family NAD(P)-dependent oxidoreductase [Streptomyces sp. NPDC055749]